MNSSTGYSEQVFDDRAQRDDPPEYRLRPGHAQLFFTLLLALVGYAIVYFTVKPTENTVPVLFYVLLILVITGALMTAASFWLDLYRLPVPIVLLTVGVILSLASRNDHYFKMQRRGRRRRPSRRRFMTSFASGNRTRPSRIRWPCRAVRMASAR